MKRFLVLYRTEGALGGISVSEMFANTLPEQMAAGMAAWQAWHEKSGGAVVDLRAPLDHSTTIKGGSESSGRSSITGYSILQAESMDEAAARMKEHPHFRAPGSSVEILESVSMPGMG